MSDRMKKYVMGRVHDEDVAGPALKQGNWAHLCLRPAVEAEPAPAPPPGKSDPVVTEGTLTARRLRLWPNDRPEYTLTVDCRPKTPTHEPAMTSNVFVHTNGLVYVAPCREHSVVLCLPASGVVSQVSTADAR